MRPDQIAAQLYTCRDLLKTPADIAATLKRVRAAGYTAVQVSGMGPIAEEELVRILDSEGLVCCATHESGASILNEPQKVIDRLKRLGTKITAYPYPADIDLSSAVSVNGLIGGLEKSGKLFAEAGLTLCYHNHHQEFRKLGGKIILDLIYDGTSPEYLQGEPDTYWVQFGGGNNVTWCEKLSGRLPIIHLKDYLIDADNKPQLCEIGAGNLEFDRIIPAAEAAGCQWFVVEQDTCPGDPVDSLAQSYRYIAEKFL